MPFVTVRTAAALYQDPKYDENHFAQLEMGRMEVYAVSPQPLGVLPHVSKVMALPRSDVIFHVEFEDRFVILIAGSIATRNMWVRKLRGPFAPPPPAGSRASQTRRLLFEGVLIKSPTKPTADNGLVDAVKSTMGAYHHRLFRLYSDGSLAYHDAQPHACIALNSSSVSIIVEAGPVHRRPNEPPFEFTVAGDTAEFPVPPTEPLPPLSNFSRLVWRWSEVVRPPRKDLLNSSVMTGADDLSDDEGDSALALSSAVARPKKTSVIHGRVTLATPTEELRRNWVEQIANYASWHLNEKQALEMERQVVTKGWGWLKGKPGHVFSSWQLCYLVLLSTRELVYYKDENGHELLGSFSLVNVSPENVKVVKSVINAPAPMTVEVQLGGDEGNVVRFCPKAKSSPMTSAHALHWQRVISGAENRFHALHLGRSTLVEQQVDAGYDSLEFFMMRSVERMTIPVVTRSSWQLITGNCPVDLLSHSPEKASLLLKGQAEGDSKSYLNDTPSRVLAAPSAHMRRYDSEGPKAAAKKQPDLPQRRKSAAAAPTLFKTTSAG